MKPTGDAYLKQLMNLVLSSSDISGESRRTFLEAVGGAARATGIRCIFIRIRELDVNPHEERFEQLWPRQETAEESGAELADEVKDDKVIIRVTARVSVPYDEEEAAALRERAEVVLSLILQRIHRIYLYNHRKSSEKYDAQTGVYNENYAMSYLDNLLIRGNPEKYIGCTFNIRGMSVINNRFGTENGTKIMRMYVEKLQALIAPDGIVARIASDRFIAFFTTEKKDEVIGYLNGSEMDVAFGAHAQIMMSAWAGYDYLHPDLTAMEISDRLGDALRTAKYEARASYLFYDERIQRQVRQRRHIESLFPGAVRDEEFQVYYQPKVDLKNYRLTGAEALCRWVHDGEIIYPDKFIPALEHSGDICMLDFYMLEHVCRDMREWISEGRPCVRTSVNLSRCHMGDPKLKDTILAIVDSYQIPHDLIEVELTETMSDTSIEELKGLVEELDRAGICCSVDDFGVGYSSMNALRETPWRVIKIDRSFMPTSAGLEGDEERVEMLKTLIGLTHTLGIECLAEGVETMEQIVLLKTSGCMLAQGYYFDRPMPGKQFAEKLLEIKGV